ncbi:HNH endonuclease, partial [Candidatus Poribacteria bacterium]|nr:HNH endonuclease [Candidatus Poribacteria bacterium]
RNAVYAGTWLSDAKRYFSRNGCAAYQIGNAYVDGSPIRQEYLETAIKWISKDSIEDYMGKHQHDENASPLWEYFQSVIDWVESTFTKTRPKMMKGVDWGSLYNAFGDADLDADEIERETARLVLDDDVTQKKGIYPYILTREEKHLNIRAFSDGMKLKVYEKQSGFCVICDDKFTIKEMEADHITPWSEDGKTNEDNCQMLCKKCNREKSAR